MNTDNIKNIASITGWYISLTQEATDCFYFDFQYKLSNGSIYSFTVEYDPDTPEVLLEDLKAVLQNFDVEQYTEEILEGIIQLTPSIYFQIRREIEDIQVKVWHLWLELCYLNSKIQFFDRPDHTWN